jgi:aerobic carbon-monoxide dehydrogenase medium subunit
VTPTLHRPESLEETCSLLDSLDDAMVYGGGTAIQILLKQGVLFAGHLVDISTVPGLATVERTATGLRSGPMATVRQMETDPAVREDAPLLAETYGRVANPRVRNTASVGGNIAHGDYRLDPPTALLVLDAQVELSSVRGRRRVPIRQFFVDFQVTAVEPGELVTGIETPRPEAGAGWSYVKLSALGRNDWPAASAAALVDPQRMTLRLGLGAVAAVPTYVEVPIGGLSVDESIEAAVEAVTPLLDPIPDVRGSAAYKKRLGLVATQDAARQAWEDAR